MFRARRETAEGSRRDRRHVSPARRQREHYEVAFYVPWIGPLLVPGTGTTTGGAETQIFLLARALVRQGVRVRLLAFELPDTEIPPSIDGVAISLRPPYRAHQRLGKLREIVTLCRTVLGSHADIVVTRAAGPHVGLAGMFARLSRRRFVYSSANVSDFGPGALESRRRNDLLFRLGVRLADRIVVQTDEQVRLCEKRFGREPVRIDSIAELAEPRACVPEAFLWIGRLVWYKRPLAYVELARLLPEATFWMVPVPVAYTEGGDELGQELARQAAATPNLELLPPMPRGALLELIERCVAVVNTSDFEGMPNVFLEGWARGVPALTMSHDPDGAVERHGLGAFAHGSATELAERAGAMWDGRNDQSEIAGRCRAYVSEHHSPDAVAARWREALGLGSERARTSS